MAQINPGVNPQLLKLAREAAAKLAFVPGGDPAMDPAAAAGGGGGGMDPAAMGGGMDPAAMMGGGGAAMPPAAPPPAPPSSIQPAMAGSVEPIKPKIDVNVTLLQILKILAKIADTLGVPIPASEMVATQSDLTNFGMQQENPQVQQQGSAIQPISPIQGASPQLAGGDTSKQGSVFDGNAAGVGIGNLGDRASMILHMQRARRNAN